MTITAVVKDGFQNLVANLGTARDKRTGNTYVQPVQDDELLTAMHRSSFVARHIVEMPAEDTMREWREWQAPTQEAGELRAEETRLGVQGKAIFSMKRARLYGGSALFIGTGDSDLTEPLDPSTVKKDGLKYLTPLMRNSLSAGEVDRDPSSEYYGKPSMYSLQSHVGQQDIHPSRLVIDQGGEFLDDNLATASSGWGDSALLACLSAIENYDATMANVASLVFEAKIDVMGIKDLTSNLRSGGEKFEQLMLRMTTLANTAKGINGTLLMDSEDTYSQKSANFANLPNVIDRYMQACGAAAGMPVTRLFGVSPGGLNATGESDTDAYYDRIKVLQTLRVQPRMRILDECLVRSATGTFDESELYKWRPLWQPTAKERAETGKLVSDTFKTVYDMGVLPPEALAKGVVNGMTESGIAPGLEDLVEKYYNPDLFDDPEEKDAPEVTEEPTEVDDAAPRTLYVYRKVLNAAAIINWFKKQGFTDTLAAKDLHVTIAYSRDAVDWMKMGEHWQETIEILPGGARIVEKLGTAQVLLFNSSDLSYRNRQMIRRGASWDYDDYQPHITISYDTNSPDLSEVKPYTGKIVLGHEVFEELNPEWSEASK